MYQKTKSAKKLRIELFNSISVEAIAYSSFQIDDESNAYKLHLGAPSSLNKNFNNQFSLSNDMPFQTYDKTTYRTCPSDELSGWWFNTKGCSCSNTYCSTCGCTTFCPLCNNMRFNGILYNEFRMFIEN